MAILAKCLFKVLSAEYLFFCESELQTASRPQHCDCVLQLSTQHSALSTPHIYPRLRSFSSTSFCSSSVNSPEVCMTETPAADPVAGTSEPPLPLSASAMTLPSRPSGTEPPAAARIVGTRSHTLGATLPALLRIPGPFIIRRPSGR